MEGVYGIGYLIINIIFNVGLSLIIVMFVGILIFVFIVKIVFDKLGKIL